MNFHIKHRQAVCPAELEQKIRSKFTRIRRLLPDNSYTELELSERARVNDKGDKEAEVVIQIPGVRSLFRYKAQAQTFLAAVDKTLDAIDLELSRWHDRRTAKRHHKTSLRELGI